MLISLVGTPLRSKRTDIHLIVEKRSALSTS